MTTKTRIKPQKEPLSDELQRRIDKIIPNNMTPPQLYLSVAKNERLFIDLVDMGLIGSHGILKRKYMDPYLRELIILRTCIATNNLYEFNLHKQTISKKMGVSSHKINDIQNSEPSSSIWAEKERALFKFIDEFISTDTLSNKGYDDIYSKFSEEDLIEMTLLIGLYTTVGMLVQLIRPELDNYETN